MDQRISLITLGVADVSASRAFYQRIGWKESSISNEHVAFFQVGGMIFSLYGREHLAADAKQPAEGTGFSGFALAHNVASKAKVDAVLAEAEAAGAKILAPAEEKFWGGYSGYFADPDDHAWEIAWNPGFDLKEDGRIFLPQ
ncbi:VOC family protein [soil metagenome]